MHVFSILNPWLSLAFGTTFTLISATTWMRAFIVSCCRAAVLQRGSAGVLLVLGLAGGSVALAQTAHFVSAEDPLYTYANGVYALLPLGTGGNSMAVDSSGNIYVINANSAHKETPTATPNIYTDSVIKSGLTNGAAIAVDTQLDVFIADAGVANAYNGIVYKETPAGNGYTETIVANYANGLGYPDGLAVNGIGDVFIADGLAGNNLIYQAKPSANSYTVSVLRGPFVLCEGCSFNPLNLAVDGSNNLYASMDNTQVMTFTYYSSSEGYDEGFVYLKNDFSFSSMTVDTSGNIYLNDSVAWTLYKYTELPTEYVQSVVPTFPYSDPVVLDPAGNLYLGGSRLTSQGAALSDSLETGQQATPNFFNTVSLLFIFDSPGTLGSVSVLTEGASGQDFTYDGAPNNTAIAACTAGTAYTTGELCGVQVLFRPSLPGSRYGAVVLKDTNGNAIATGYVQGSGLGPQVILQPGNQNPVGSGLINPTGVAVDGNGNVYISDYGNNRELKETVSAGIYTQNTIASSGLGHPVGIAVDGGGDVYFTDTFNNQILKETPSPTGVGFVESVAVPSAPSALDNPNGVAVDGLGNLYIADTGNNRVLMEKLSASGYTQTTIPTSHLSHPNGVAVDGNGNVYIADTYNNRVVMETLAEGSFTETQDFPNLNSPLGVAVDAMGNVYIADFGNNRVVEETPTAGGYYQNTVPTTGLLEPYAVAVDGLGNVYIADYGNSRVVLDYVVGFLFMGFWNIPIGSTSESQTVTVQNNGNSALTFTQVSYPAGFPEAGTAASECALSTSLEPSATCTVTVAFSATTLGNDVGYVELAESSLFATNFSQSILLSGIAVQDTQAISFTAPSPVLYGTSPISLSATGGASGNPVTLSIVSGPGSLSGTNNNILTVTGTGTIVIVANQAGNTDYSAAPQVTQSIVVDQLAALTAPTPGSILTGSSAIFQWTAGTGVTQYVLGIGSTGVGSYNLFNSTPIAATQASVTGLPANGEKLYARLYSLINGAWQYHDYTYTAAATPAVLTSPTPGSTLTSSSATFQWTAGSGVTQYVLGIGSTGVGSYDLYNSTPITATQASVTGLPINGETLYARLYSLINGTWQYHDYTYTASATPAVLTSPTPGTALTSSSVTFQWTAGTGVTQYVLGIGSTGVGSYDLYNSTPITATQASVTGLPANGEKLYARLYSLINGAWQYNDYTYTATATPTPAVLTSPAPSSTLTSSSATFQWTAGTGVTQYVLGIGSTGVGSYDLFNSTPITATQATVTGLPTNGEKLYARLYSLINGAWQYNDYTYTAQ